MNKDKEIRFLYYDACKEYMDILVGNEIAMQQRINLSIQIPKDRTFYCPCIQMLIQRDLALRSSSVDNFSRLL